MFHQHIQPHNLLVLISHANHIISLIKRPQSQDYKTKWEQAGAYFPQSQPDREQFLFQDKCTSFD